MPRPRGRGKRNFNSYSKSYQLKLLQQLKKEVLKNYDKLSKKLQTKDVAIDESIFSMPKNDIIQMFKVYRQRIKNESLIESQVRNISKISKVIETQGSNIFQDRIDDMVFLEGEISGKAVAKDLRNILESMSEEQLQAFFNSKYYIVIRNYVDSLGLMEYVNENSHSPMYERVVDFCSKNNIPINPKFINSFK